MSIIIRSAIAQGGFNNYYPSGYLSTGNKILEIESGKFMVTSYYKDSVTHQQGLDLKHVNLQGNEILRKRYQFQNMEFLSFNHSQFQNDLSQRTAILTAGTYSGSISKLIYLSIDKITLDTNWVKYYGDGINKCYFNSLFKINSNEIILFGDRGNNTSARPAYLKIDTLGNILSIKQYASLEKHSVKASCFDTIQKLIYFTGNNYNNSYAHKTYIACADTIGNVVWKSEFPNSQFNPFFSEIKLKNNYLILCGSQGEFKYGGFSQSKLLIAKINASNGSVIWYRKYFDAFFTNYLPSFVINEDESIVAVGSGGFFNPVVDYNNDGIILKVNSAGDSLWMQSFGQYGVGTNEIFYDVTRSSDGGYVMCGLSNNPANLHTWVVKTDSLGNGPGRTTAIYEKAMEDHSVYVYPNPANKHVTIEFSSFTNHTKPKEIQLVDVLGREVKTILIESKTQKINIEDLPNGVYYLQLQTPSGLKITKKLVKE